MTYQCLYCDRVYKRKKPYEKHETMCKLLKQSSMQQNDEETSALNVFELTRMVNMLVSQNKKLNDRITKLEDNAYKKNIKIDIIKWLNTYNTRCKYDLMQWVKNIVITNDHINYLLSNNLKNTIIKVINENYNDESPIISFIQKKNFYVFKNDNWVICDNDGFSNIISNVRNMFMQYVQKNISLAKQQELYVSVLTKLTGANSKDTTMENLNSSIYKHIYKTKKINFKTFIEFEIN